MNTKHRICRERREIKEDLTRMLSFPWKTEDTASMSSSLCCGRDTSQIEPVTSKPESLHSLRHLLSSPSFLAHVCTLAPNPTSSSTMACLFTHQNHKLAQKGRQWIEEWGLKLRSLVPNSASSTGDKRCHPTERPLGMLCWCVGRTVQHGLPTWHLMGLMRVECDVLRLEELVRGEWVRVDSDGIWGAEREDWCILF